MTPTDVAGLVGPGVPSGAGLRRWTRRRSSRSRAGWSALLTEAYTALVALAVATTMLLSLSAGVGASSTAAPPPPGRSGAGRPGRGRGRLRPGPAPTAPPG